MRTHKVVCGGNFEVGGRTHHHLNVEAGDLGDRGIVGQRPDRRCAVRCQNRLKSESLRCLGLPQTGARHGLLYPTVHAAFERVDDRHAGQRTVGFVKSVENAVDQARRDKRPGGVMDQHPLRRVFGQGFEAGCYRALACRAARDGIVKVESIDGSVVVAAPRRIDHHPNAVDARVGGKGCHGPGQQRPAGDLHILFERAGAGTIAMAGSNDQGNGFRHGTCVVGC